MAEGIRGLSRGFVLHRHIPVPAVPPAFVGATMWL